MAAGIRKRNGPSATVEKRNAQLFFQHRHLLTYRWLGNRHRQSCACETLAFGGRNERAKLPQVHGLPFHAREKLSIWRSKHYSTILRLSSAHNVRCAAILGYA